jgi:hypothetical protein
MIISMAEQGTINCWKCWRSWRERYPDWWSRKDTFILGNATQVFYDDRNATTAGTGDYA